MSVERKSVKSMKRDEIMDTFLDMMKDPKLSTVKSFRKKTSFEDKYSRMNVPHGRRNLNSIDMDSLCKRVIYGSIAKSALHDKTDINSEEIQKKKDVLKMLKMKKELEKNEESITSLQTLIDKTESQIEELSNVKNDIFDLPFYQCICRRVLAGLADYESGWDYFNKLVEMDKSRKEKLLKSKKANSRDDSPTIDRPKGSYVPPTNRNRSDSSRNWRANSPKNNKKEEDKYVPPHMRDKERRENRFSKDNEKGKFRESSKDYRNRNNNGREHNLSDHLPHKDKRDSYDKPRNNYNKPRDNYNKSSNYDKKSRRGDDDGFISLDKITKKPEKPKLVLELDFPSLGGSAAAGESTTVTKKTVWGSSKDTIEVMKEVASKPVINLTKAQKDINSDERWEESDESDPDECAENYDSNSISEYDDNDDVSNREYYEDSGEYDNYDNEYDDECVEEDKKSTNYNQFPLLKSVTVKENDGSSMKMEVLGKGSMVCSKSKDAW